MSEEEAKRIRWANRLRWCSQLYIAMAFSGATMFHLMDSTAAYAQEQSTYALAARIDVERAQLDQLEGKTDAIERHLENTDKLVNENSKNISQMTGAGEGILTALTILQIFGLITQMKIKGWEKKGEG